MPTHSAARPVAAVIVTYRSRAVIGDCLRSLRAEFAELPDARIIVVDNASDDDTLSIVAAEVPEAEIIARPTNDGFAAGVNAGLAAAEGHDVLVLNPDIRLSPGCVAALRPGLAAPGTGIVVPRLLDADGHRHHSLRRRPTALRALGEAVLGGDRAGRIALLGETVVDRRSYRDEHRVDWATGAAWLVSRDCIDAVGLLDERYFLYSEETDYMLRAGELGYGVRYMPDAEAVHLGGEQSSSPWLWSLGATNKVRLQRERRGRGAAVAMWLAVVLNELVRAVARGPVRGATHRRALRELLPLRKWPRRHDTDDGAAYVCFSAQDWWYHNQAHSDFQLMRSVARDRRVLVVNSIGMRMPMPGRSTHVLRKVVRKLRSVAKFLRRPLPDLPEFFVLSPLPLPFYGSPLLRRVNAGLVRAQVRLACALLRIRRPVIVVTIPTAWDVVRPMRRSALVFNRSDRHSEFPESDRSTIEALERDLLRHADHVLYVSHALLEQERTLTGERAHFLDHGVDLDHFRRRTEAEVPADLAAVPRPRVGFFGALDDFVVDFDLLEYLADELPEASLVLIGDAGHDMTELTARPTVHWLGFRPYERIPAYGSGFDVAIMPWADSEWIRYCNPIKLKEYLALELAVVTTPFAEAARFGDHLTIASGKEEFVAAVRKLLSSGAAEPNPEARAAVAGSSWHSRAGELVALIERSVPEIK